jgi:hypothetical protein
MTSAERFLALRARRPGPPKGVPWRARPVRKDMRKMILLVAADVGQFTFGMFECGHMVMLRNLR